jgi:hypothetical protein
LLGDFEILKRGTASEATDAVPDAVSDAVPDAASDAAAVEVEAEEAVQR